MVTKTWPYPTDYHEWIAQTNALRDEVARLRAENKLLRAVFVAAATVRRERLDCDETCATHGHLWAALDGDLAALDRTEASGG